MAGVRPTGPQLRDYCAVVERGSISRRQAPGSENGCSAVRSVRSGSAPSSSSAPRTRSEMNGAHYLWIAMGCLEQGTTMQLHDAHPGVRSRSKPESLQHGDHRAASGHSTGRHRRGGLTLAQVGLTHQFAAPRPACLDGIGAWLLLVCPMCAANTHARAAYSRAPWSEPTSRAALYNQAGRPRPCAAAWVRTTSPPLDSLSRCSRIVLGC